MKNSPRSRWLTSVRSVCRATAVLTAWFGLGCGAASPRADRAPDVAAAPVLHVPATPCQSRHSFPRCPAAPLPIEPSGLLAKTEALPAQDVKQPDGPRSTALPSGFFNPMPGGVIAGYQADTGLDIAGSPRPVFAIASGTLDYSEPGHTLWTGSSDTPNSIRIELDDPIPWNGHLVTHVYYTHLSALETLQREDEQPRKRVEAGEMLGVSGIANRSPHLHLGFLLDGNVTQYQGTFLYADQIRKVLGGYKNGDILPRDCEGCPPKAPRPAVQSAQLLRKTHRDG